MYYNYIIHLYDSHLNYFFYFLSDTKVSGNNLQPFTDSVFADTKVSILTTDTFVSG